jgi:hypothetical protein
MGILAELAARASSFSSPSLLPRTGHMEYARFDIRSILHNSYEGNVMLIENLESRQMFSVATATASDPTPASAQPPVEADLHITRKVDMVSPKLLLACCDGAHISN